MSAASIDLAQTRRALERWLAREDLPEREAAELLAALAHPELPAALGGALLAALRAKGPSADELRGFAVAMRRLVRRPEIAPDAVAVDIVGTGGDASGSLNLSTGAALLTAACGVPVVKHGNRSVSSRCGSADVLEQFGLTLPLDERAAAACLERTGFTFLFAPYFHPAMKVIAPIRQALGVRTIFNVLGPLTNPAAPAHHVIGAFDLATAQLMAKTLAGLPQRRSFVIHGAEGWDEPTPIGPFALFDVENGEVRAEMRAPADYGLATCTPSDLAGGDAAANAASLCAVLEGRTHGPQRDALLLGAALALEVCGIESTPRAAIARAAAALDSGAGARIVAALRAFGEGRVA
jgi:anthranilate phosphoribosyltransferase